MVSARREGDTVIVFIPGWMSDSEERRWVDEMVRRLERSEDPFLHFQSKDIKEWITRGLSRAERLIIILYYFEEMTMKEIGETLALSESRVSQMHSAILVRLKEHLAGRKELSVR